MQVRYGAYSFATNSVKWTTSIQTQLEQNVPTLTRVTVNLEGRLEGSGQIDLATKSGQLQRALLTPYLDLVLLSDSGVVVEALRSGGSTTGVVCVSGPDFFSADGAEFATYRSFRAVFQADYPITAQSVSAVISWTQTVTFGGGEPVILDQLAIDGPGVSVMVSPQTPYTASQTGQAVGLYAYPPIPKPLFGQPRRKQVSMTAPTRSGRGLINYPITWSYEFASWRPLTGGPGVPP
jgi:hypothetical protein